MQIERGSVPGNSSALASLGGNRVPMHQSEKQNSLPVNDDALPQQKNTQEIS